MGYLYIFLCILFTTYGQLVFKWRINLHGGIPDGYFEKIKYFISLFGDLYIVSAYITAFLASIAWMAALTKFELSFAYPFMSLSFVSVFFFSTLFLNETVTLPKIIGLLLVFTGLVVMSKG